MGGIFINYRRNREHVRFVQKLHDRLVEFLGEGQAFLDKPAIDVGEDFRHVLEERLLDSEVVIAVIHQEWVAELDNEGKDWVREELELALRHQKKIIPLLLDGVKMPTAAVLPESICEVAYRQAHEVHVASCDHDLDALVEKLELFVAPPWKQPGDPKNVASTPPRGWVGYLVGSLTLGALVVPMWFLPDLASAREVAIDVSLWLLALMLAPLTAILVMFLSRRPVNVAEERVHDMPLGKYYTRVAGPLGILAVLVVLSMILASPVTSGALPFLLFIVIIATAYVVVTILGQRKEEERRETEWPQRLREPVRAAVVRQELSRLERLVRRPTSRPTWALRLRANWHLQHLNAAGTALFKDAERGRWRWLTADHPWLLCLSAVWVAGTVGLMTAAALPRLVVWVPVIVAAFAYGVAAMTVELAYRRQRRQRREVAEEVRDHTGRIEERLKELRSRRG